MHSSSSHSNHWIEFGLMSSGTEESNHSIQLSQSPSSPAEEKESIFGGSWSSSISSISSLSSEPDGDEFIFPLRSNHAHQPTYPSVAVVLECANCRDLASPPIFICARGHHVCSLCKPKLTMCPAMSCDAPMTSTRNIGLEHLATLCLKPCCFAAGGCNKMLPQDLLQAHKAECSLRPFSCPYLLCRKQIPGKDLHQHLERQHGLYPHHGSSVVLTFALPRCSHSPNRRGSSDTQSFQITPTTDWIADPQLILTHGQTFVAKLSRTRGRFGNGDALWIFWLWIDTSRSEAFNYTYEATLVRSFTACYPSHPLTWRVHSISLRALMTEVMAGDDVITLTDAMISPGILDEPEFVGPTLTLKLQISAKTANFNIPMEHCD